MSFVDGETNKMDLHRLLQELEHLQERIKIRYIDRIVYSILNELLDNDIAESEPHASGPEGNHPQRFGKMVRSGGCNNLSNSDSLSLPNFST